MDWKPTHIIVFYDSERQEVTTWLVMQFLTEDENIHYDGFYSKYDWEKAIPSNWRKVDGELLYNGNPTPDNRPGTVYIVETGEEIPDTIVRLQKEVEVYETPQEVCPKCKSNDIANHGPVEDGELFVTCDNCGLQWHEPAEEE